MEHYSGRGSKVVETQVNMRFFRVLRRSSSVWRSVGTSQGVKGLTGKYVWLGEVREQYTEARKVILTNKYWKAGRDCLEQEMVSTFSEWLEVSIWFFCR